MSQSALNADPPGLRAAFWKLIRVPDRLAAEEALVLRVGLKYQVIGADMPFGLGAFLDRLHLDVVLFEGG
jgi:hypothetical protein